MRKAIAIGILTTMVTGLMAWAGTTISRNKTEVAELKVHKEYMHTDIKEIKADVKEIKQLLQEKRK